MDNKHEYSKAKEAELEKWNARLNLWKAKSDLAKAEARAEYETLVEDLTAKESAARKKIEDLKNASDQAWSELTGGVEKALGELTSSLDRAVKKFS